MKRNHSNGSVCPRVTPTLRARYDIPENHTFNAREYHLWAERFHALADSVMYRSGSRWVIARLREQAHLYRDAARKVAAGRG